jgi:hypothetical protein
VSRKRAAKMMKEESTADAYDSESVANDDGGGEGDVVPKAETSDVNDGADDNAIAAKYVNDDTNANDDNDNYHNVNDVGRGAAVNDDVDNHDDDDGDGDDDAPIAKSSRNAASKRAAQSSGGRRGKKARK